jgi:hypothetical protein
MELNKVYVHAASTSAIDYDFRTLRYTECGNFQSRTLVSALKHHAYFDQIYTCVKENHLHKLAGPILKQPGPGTIASKLRKLYE